jgi:hypothetical protein
VSNKVVHGDDLLYRFFRDLFKTEPELLGVVPQLLVESMAIWLPPEVYQHSPVLMPWVVRDPQCRGSKTKNIPDQWASPNEGGYLRDDNSLVKSLTRSLSVRGPRGSHLNGSRMGSEFVASHIWRKVDADSLASRIPLLNTLVRTSYGSPRRSPSYLTSRAGSCNKPSRQFRAASMAQPQSRVAYNRSSPKRGPCCLNQR